MGDLKKQDSLDECKKIVHTYPLLRHTDMPEDLKNETMELIVSSCEKHPTNNETQSLTKGPESSNLQEPIPTENTQPSKPLESIATKSIQPPKLSSKPSTPSKSKKAKSSNNLNKYIVGTCMYMCPLDEASFRQSEKLTHKLEKYMDSSNNYTQRVNRQAVVKQFVRSGAGTRVSPNTVRPFPILCNTMCHLLRVCDRDNLPWWQVYEFVHDRVRAIKQDIMIQGLTGPSIVPLLVSIVRFYTYSQYRLCQNHISEFEPKLNLQHLAESLKSVLEILNESCSKLHLDSEEEYRSDDENSLSELELDDNDESSLESDGSDSESDEEFSIADGGSNGDNPHLKENKKDCVNKTNTEVTSDSDDIREKSKCNNKPSTNACEQIEEKLNNLTIDEENTINSNPDNNINEEKFLIESNPDKNTNDNLPNPNRQNKREYNSLNPLKPHINYDANLSTNLDDYTLKYETISHIKKKKLSPQDIEWAELEALNLLVHINDEFTLQHVLTLPKRIRNTRLLKSIIAAAIQLTIGNFRPILKLFHVLPPLYACALHRNITAIQRNALGQMSRAYNNKTLHYSYTDLVSLLSFSSVDSLKEAACHYGLKNSENGVVFNKADFDWNIDLAAPQKYVFLDENLSISISNLLTLESLSSSYKMRRF